MHWYYHLQFVYLEEVSLVASRNVLTEANFERNESFCTVDTKRGPTLDHFAKIENNEQFCKSLKRFDP